MAAPQTLYALASVVLVSLVSLVGIATVAVKERTLRSAIFVLVSLAAGAMFGDAFIHLLPQAYGQSTSPARSSLYVLLGILLLFVLEKLLRWRHEHRLRPGEAIQPVGYMNLVADGIHNLIDGLLIGASYLTGPDMGVATTAAVLLHEIPQEIGDFGILLQAGFSRSKALLFNWVSASVAIFGTALSLLIGAASRDFAVAMLPLTAGGFIYIAGTDLLPELQREARPAKSIAQLVALVIGAGMMMMLAWLE